MDWGLKQRQRRDVRMQCRDVLESETTNVAMLRLNVAKFQRVVKINVATLVTNVATFQREGLIRRREVPEKGLTDVTTLRRRDVESQRRDVTKKA